MRITFIESFATERQGFVQNRAYDVTDDVGRQFIKQKLARPSKPDEKLDVTSALPADVAAANVAAQKTA